MKRFFPMVALMGACGFNQLYRPLKVPNTGAPATAFAAAAAALMASGFERPVRIDDRSALDAVTPANRGMRDHVVVAIAPSGEVTVDLRTEIASAEGWLRSDLTCPGYSYNREKRLGELIVARIHSME